MKKLEVCADFLHRRLGTRYVRCFFCAISLLTTDNALRAEEGSELQTNVRTASDSSVLSANTVAGLSNVSVSASADGSVSSATGTTVHSSGENSLNTVGTKLATFDATSSVQTSASTRPVASTPNLSQPSAIPAQTAPTNTSNNISSSSSATTSTTASGVMGTSGATASGVTTATTTSAATPSSTDTITSATGSASTAPNTATSSQTSPAPASIPLAAGSGANNAAPTPEEEPQDLGDILDLRPPAKLKVSLLPWVIALLVVLSAVGLWFLLKRKRRRKAKKEKPTKPIEPYEAVLQALKEASQKLDVANPKPFAFFLTDAVRLYLSRIFRLPAPESTTQELLQQLPWCTELTDDLRTNITQFLQRCDLVKFTTMPFDEPFLLQLHQQAEAIVAASHEITKPKPAPAATCVASSSKSEKISKK